MTATNRSEFSVSIMLVAALLAAVALIYLIIFFIAEDGYGKNMQRVNQQGDATLITRIKPVVTIADITGGDSAVDIQSVVTAKSPRELYDGACLACHNTGVAGAPKLGDAEAWSVRSEAGVDALLVSAITGKGAMPPNGGSAFSEAEMKSIIEMMLVEAGLMDAPVAATGESEITEMQEVVNEPVKAVILGAPALDLAAGEQAYKAACFACHDFGVAGAPKLGDKNAWSARIATGFDALLNTAINGKGAMPAKGAATHLSDAEISNIVAFMMDKVK